MRDYLRRSAASLWRAALALAISTGAHAQISTDASLGRAAQTLQGPNYILPETLGRLAGSNLFHSFSVFNINTGQSATFTTSTLGIANVISRVTSGSPSAINGLLRLDAASGAPNFFFINPAGVLFGAGASISVPGAFHVTTADYIKFADGRFFADAAASSVLSSAPPEAFGFLGTTRGTVAINDGAVLATNFLKPFSIVAGDIEVDGGIVATSGGDIRIVALGQRNQEVSLAGALPTAAGRLSILNGGNISSTSTAAQDAGNIRVSAGSISIDGQGSSDTTGILSQASSGSSGNAGAIDINVLDSLAVINLGTINTSTLSTGAAGSVNVTAGGNVFVVNGGGIASNTQSAGAAGSVRVRAANILIDGGGDLTGIGSLALAGAGNAGLVEVTAAGNLFVVNGGQIGSSTLALGNAGAVRVSAAVLTLDSQGYTGGSTGINSQADLGSSGNAGPINVTATGNLSVLNGSQISSGTFAAGNAGTVTVSGGNITIDGGGSTSVTGIASQAESTSTGSAGRVVVTTTGNLSLLNGGLISSNTFAAGDAGRVEVTTAGNLSLLNGGAISSDTFSSGDAGPVTVNAGGITIDTQGGNTFTGISSDAERGSGNAGSVNVSSTGNVWLLNGGLISSNTFTAGDAGKVEVTTAGILSLLNGGVISSDTFAGGDAGTVTVNAGSILIDAKGSTFNTGIFSRAIPLSTGSAGEVKVTAIGGLSVLNGGLISSDTFSSGDAGSVTVNAHDITIDRQTSSSFTGISSDAESGSSGNAGSIQITASGNLSVLNGGQISSGTIGVGDAGTVTVGAGSIVIDGNGRPGNTGIFSQADTGSTGNAGEVNVRTPGSLSVLNGGRISSSTFSSGNAGSVRVDSGSITIDGQGSGGLTGIFSQANQGSTGSAGEVNVTTAGSLSVLNGGQISSDTFSLGDAGSITVNAGDITIDGQGSNTFTGISSDAERGSSGNAGEVNVTASGNLLLLNAGVISSSALASGDAGGVNVRASNITIDNRASSFVTGIFSAAFESSSGNAGSVEVTAKENLSVLSGGSISSSTRSFGNAGSVTVNAESLLVDGVFDGTRSSINATAVSGSSGQTGSVDIIGTRSVTLSNGGALSISNSAQVASPGSIVPTLLSVVAPVINLNSGGQITAASSGNIAASNIEIDFGSRLVLTDSAITTSARDGNGGAIRIIGNGVVALQNAQITTSVLGLSGNGGDISVTADALVLNTGFIQANTAATDATGGNVTIDVQSLVPSGNSLAVGGQAELVFRPGVFGSNVIQAAAPTGVSGSIQITTPALDVSGTLSGLNAKLIDTGGLGRSLCQTSGGSSLAQTGRGGLPPSARDLLRFEPMLPTDAAGRPITNSTPGYPHHYFSSMGCPGQMGG